MQVKEKYEKEVIKNLTENFAIKNKFSVPEVSKVVLNVGYGKVATDEKA